LKKATQPDDCSLKGLIIDYLPCLPAGMAWNFLISVICLLFVLCYLGFVCYLLFVIWNLFAICYLGFGIY